jgi:tetraacyldisaccharide 4'-kinase
MLSPSLRDLVSGRRAGVGATLLRAGLRLCEIPFTAAVDWRNRRYDRGHATSIRVGVPVVSVGNVTLGGTGKTPVVEWVARWFHERGQRPAIVSRGYGGKPGEENDEARVLAANLPEVPRVQNPDRVAGAERAIAEHSAQRIVLDDGFQHRRLARDLDLVLLDALEPFGWGHVVPRGTLREPLAGLGRADFILLSRADLVSAEERDRIRREAARYAPEAGWAEVVHRPRALVSAQGREQELSSLRDRPVAAFCGLGNPAGFRRTLEGLGCRVNDFRAMPDHHPYPPKDLDQLGVWAGGQPIEAVLCTQKDLVKIPRESLGDKPLWAVTVGVEFLSGQAELESRLEGLQVGRPG